MGLVVAFEKKQYIEALPLVISIVAPALPPAIMFELSIRHDILLVELPGEQLTSYVEAQMSYLLVASIFTVLSGENPNERF